MRHSYSTLIHRLNIWPAIVLLSGTFIFLTAALTIVFITTALATAPAYAEEDAAESEAEDVQPETATIDPQYLQMQAFAKQLDPAELSWLGDDDKAFIALYRPALKPSQMAVVLLPDSLHKLVQYNILRELYTELPEKDWSTLHIALPALIEKPAMAADINEVTDVDSNTAPADNTNSEEAETAQDEAVEESSFADREKALGESALARIDLGTKFLLENDAKAITLVAENLTAKWAITAAIQQKDNTSGLVLWQVDDAQLDEKLLKELAESRITLLDIVDQNMHSKAKAQRIRRFKMAGFEDDYRLITSPYGRAGIEQSQRRIRQWLETGFQKY